MQICVQRQCQPLSEDKFKPIIADNYYTNADFWFELDHGQANTLISLLSPLSISPGISVPQTKTWISLFQPPPSHESGLEHHSDDSIVRSDSSENDFSLNGCIQPLDTLIGMKEVKQDEKSLICIKLKELALKHENQPLSLANDVNDTPNADANDIYSMGKNLDTQVGLEKKEEDPSSPFEYPDTIAQVV